MPYIIPANTTHLFMKYPNATFKAYDNSNGAGALTTQIQFMDYARNYIGYTVQTNSEGYVSSTQVQARFGLFVDRPAIITVADAKGPITQWAVDGGNTTGDVNDAPLYDWNGNQIFSANASTPGHIPQPPIGGGGGGGRVWTGVKRDYIMHNAQAEDNVLYESNADLADDEYLECMRVTISDDWWRAGLTIELEPGRGPRDRELLIITDLHPSESDPRVNGIPAVYIPDDATTAPTLLSLIDGGKALSLPLYTGESAIVDLVIRCGESEYSYGLGCVKIWSTLDYATLWIRFKIYDDDIVFIGSSSVAARGNM